MAWLRYSFDLGWLFDGNGSWYIMHVHVAFTHEKLTFGFGGLYFVFKMGIHMKLDHRVQRYWSLLTIWDIVWLFSVPLGRSVCRLPYPKRRLQ